ncbi:MAG: zinc ribbon domain-containing protein [Planctomycetes bacterium]|nr:zinc ribbon domain-containing protein [Planctomycetota bacterium]
MVTAAHEKPLQFPCKACGAKLDFAPGQEALKCGYCGYTEAIPQSAAEVKEHPFEEYDAGKRPRGLGTALKAVKCQQCAAETQVEPQVTALTCAFCGANEVIPREANAALLQPESLLPFQVTKDQVIEQFRTWIQGLWFRPNALKRQARPEGLQGVYIPYWTFDSMTHSFWTAEAGYHYYVTEKYTDAQGHSQTRQVQHTRWEPASGRHNQFFDDVLVPASRSVPEELAKGLEPFETQKLAPYKPEYLSGMVAEDYQLDMKAAWPKAKEEMDGAIRSACASKVPGDTHRNLHVTTQYMNRTYKLCLLPIWIASYRYANKPYRYLVNGQTGKVYGEAPYSWIKIALFVLSIAGLIGVIVALSSK